MIYFLAAVLSSTEELVMVLNFLHLSRILSGAPLIRRSFSFLYPVTTVDIAFLSELKSSVAILVTV